MPLLEAQFDFVQGISTQYNTSEDANGTLDSGYIKVRFEGASISPIAVIQGSSAGSTGGATHYNFSFEQDGATLTINPIEALKFTPEDSRLNDPNNWRTSYNPLSQTYASLTFVSLAQISDPEEPTGNSGECNCQSEIAALQSDIDAMKAQLNNIAGSGIDLTGFVRKNELENLVSAIGFEVEIVGERVVATD